MMSGITDITFDQVKVISSSALPLTIVTGIVAFTWKGDRNDDFDRGEIIFPVPRDNAGNLLIIDKAFEKQMTIIAFPATIENRGGGGANFGWGVDSSSIQAESSNAATVTVTLVVEGTHSYLLRIGFQVIIAPA